MTAAAHAMRSEGKRRVAQASGAPLVAAGWPSWSCSSSVDTYPLGEEEESTMPDRDAGKRSDGLRTEEHEEIRRLRRENRQLREEREILAKATAWFARETGPGRSTGS